MPEFRNPDFLKRHIRSILDFYHPTCLDRVHGGFINQLRDDGSVYDFEIKHLVGTCRFIFNYAVCASLFDSDEYLEAAAHGVAFLQDAHRDSKRGGYHWILKRREVADDTRHCYGHAFVLLAYATAHKAGLDLSAELAETFDLLERRFWRAEDRLYVDEISADWQVVSPYRGQNANMHMCEAMLSAFKATREERFLDRAYVLAERVCVDLAAQAGGLIWEHYDDAWTVDWIYNQHDPRNLFRPYGFLPGHFTEWSKLLLILERYRPESWLLPRATELFDVAMARSWDAERGGMNYTFDREGNILDTDRYYWVLAESIAAAALLALRTGRDAYWRWYDELWEWSWQHLVDHKWGAWYRVLRQDNTRYDDLKSPPSKTDYHPLGACHEVLTAL